MIDTSARLLALLGLLQSRPRWTGPELADRLGVSGRTIRNDVARLRALDYPVEATRGATGAYRLGAGASLPPLLLDDAEAVAVAIGLRATSRIGGVDQAGARALAKLEQMMPGRLRESVSALGAAVDYAPESIGTDAPDPEVDVAVLRAVASAVRRREWLRFRYRDEPRVVEPCRLLSWQRRWYLVARDVGSSVEQPDDGWRTFRVDWVEPSHPTGRRFVPREVPGGDATAFMMRDVASSGWAVHARLRVEAPASEVLARVNASVGAVEAVDDARCVLVTGADSLATVAAYIGMLDLDFTVESPPGLVEQLDRFAQRYARAVAASRA